MMEHDGCVGCKYESYDMKEEPCMGCKQNAVDRYIRKTNADRIREMTDDQLAIFLYNIIFEEEGNWATINFSIKGDYYQAVKNDPEDIEEWLESGCDD